MPQKMVSMTQIKHMERKTKHTQIMKKALKSKVVCLLTLLCFALQAGAVDFKGSGTLNNPYLIENLADLKAFCKSVYDGSTTYGNTAYSGKYFKQTADIVVNENVIKSDGTFNEAEKSKFTNWVPAGKKSGAWTSRFFGGIYDGGGHSISGLYFGEDMDDVVVGLFGQVDGSILQNITIKDSYMGCKPAGTYNEASNSHGFLTGRASNSTITNCHVVNSVIDSKPTRSVFVGGLVGCLLAGTTSKVKNCSFSGTINVTSQESAFYLSGMVGEVELGRNAKVSMEGCTVKGTMNLSIDHGYACESATLSALCYLKPYSTEEILDMTECANYMTVKVSSIGFGNVNVDDVHIDDHSEYPKEWYTQYKHMKVLNIYEMCGAVSSMTNCANFGNVKLGNPDYKSGNPYLTLFAIDDLTIAPAACVYKNVKSCAFYGLTSYGQNWYNWREYQTAEDGEFTLYTPKVYTVAADIRSDAAIGRVVRMEGIGVQDNDNIPAGLKFYQTTSLNDIIKDGATIVNDFSGYDEADGKAYKWGLLTEVNFKGCPIPAMLGETDGNVLLGKGTQEDPFLIQDEKDYLLAVASINSKNTSGEYYKLLADLDLSNGHVMDAIGNTDYPFAGTFDGNGHAIMGLKAKTGSMFGVVDGGMVQNLALLDMTCTGVDACYPLVGVLTNRGQIRKCYVGGDIKVGLNALSGSATARYVAGLCGTIKGGTITESYFKGKFSLDGGNHTVPVTVAGVCKDVEENESSSSNCTSVFSIFNVNTVNGCEVKSAYGVICADEVLTDAMLYGVKNYTFYMTDCENVNTTNGTRVSNYAELNSKLFSIPGVVFIRGVYNPVLPQTKSYILTDERGLDAVLVDGEGTGDMANTILHYAPAEGEDYESDHYLWQHPNLAVYNATDGAEYLINCTLDPAKDLQLNMDKAKSQTIKANVHYPLAIYSNVEENLLHMLCLPVTVQRDALPEGSKLKIIGKKTFDDTNKRYISTMVECDSVPAGVPFLLDIPVEVISATKGATYDLVLRGKMALEPVSVISVGDINMETELKGTFVNYKKESQSLISVYDKCQPEDGYYSVSNTSSQSVVSPFHAYAEVDDGYRKPEYRLINNLLLDEESTDVEPMLATYNGQTIGVVLKRKMKKDVWNTVCLPFNLSADEIATAFGNATKVEQLTSVQGNATDGATFVFSAVTEMTAGKTYLVQPAESGAIYTFANKTIANELASEPEDHLTQTFFKGSFAPMVLEGVAPLTDGKYTYNYFIQSNKLYYLPEGKSVALKGFRGWLLMSSNAIFGDSPAPAAVKLQHADGTTTGVNAIEYGQTTTAGRIYNLQGIETGEPVAPGVYIKNGKKYVKK